MAARPDAVLLLYIRNFIEDNGYAPTVREIGKELGLAPSTTHKRMAALVDAGWIERVGPRAIRINHPELFGEQTPIAMRGRADGTVERKINGEWVADA